MAENTKMQACKTCEYFTRTENFEMCDYQLSGIPIWVQRLITNELTLRKVKESDGEFCQEYEFVNLIDEEDEEFLGCEGTD
jgi:hypothetical protein